MNKYQKFYRCLGYALVIAGLIILLAYLLSICNLITIRLTYDVLLLGLWTLLIAQMVFQYRHDMSPWTRILLWSSVMLWLATVILIFLEQAAGIVVFGATMLLYVVCLYRINRESRSLDQDDEN